MPCSNSKGGRPVERLAMRGRANDELFALRFFMRGASFMGEIQISPIKSQHILCSFLQVVKDTLAPRTARHNQDQTS